MAILKYTNTFGRPFPTPSGEVIQEGGSANLEQDGWLDAQVEAGYLAVGPVDKKETAK